MKEQVLYNIQSLIHVYMYMTSIQQKNHSKNHNFITDIVTYMYIVAQDSFIVYTMYMYMYIQYIYMYSVRVHVPFCVP